jgi:SAM-dependent methyltransferase
MNTQVHWEKVYGAKAPDEVSWFRPHLKTSMSFIERSAPAHSTRIIDVGGGESTLVDDLLERGYTNVTVLDISGTAIGVTKRRLAGRADCVEWLVGDVTTVDLPADTYDVWHDRAVFRFLTSAADRAAYVERVRISVRGRPRHHRYIWTGRTYEMRRPRRQAIRCVFSARGIRKAFPSDRQHEGTPRNAIWDYSAVPVLFLRG